MEEERIQKKTQKKEQDNKPYSVRLDEDVKNVLRDIVDKMKEEYHFTNNSAVYEEIISILNMHLTADKIPEAKNDIETFNSYLRCLSDSYVNILHINKQTEERVRQEFRQRLDNKDQQISILVTERENQKGTIETLEDRISELIKELSDTKQSVEVAENKLLDREKSLEDKQTIIDSLKAQVPEQDEINAKMKALEKEINNLRASLTASDGAKADAQSKAEKAVADLEVLQKQAELAEQEHRKELAMIEKEHSKDLETMAKQATADLKAAIAEAKEAEREKAAEKEEKLQERIEGYRTKLDEQKDMIADLKARIK